MPGVIENMPIEARIERLQTLAKVLLDIVRANGGMLLFDALATAAAQLRTAVSQMKQALNYALSMSWLNLSTDDRLSAAI